MVVLGIVSLAGKSPWLAGVTVVLGFAWRSLLKAVVVNVLGDAPRYLLPLPDNVALRQRIREEGVHLIERLHGQGYDRIVILGHSLGSVIAYDIITNAWIAMNSRPAARTTRRSPRRSPSSSRSGKTTVENAQQRQYAAWRSCARTRSRGA